MRTEAIDAIDAAGFGVRLEFRWIGDRYGQIISRIQPKRDREILLESREGLPADEWPPSPPLQTLSIEKLTDGRTVALLVGMAGRSHWSASIEPVANRAGLIFDIACRHSTRPNSLGSVYRQVALTNCLLSIDSADATVKKCGELIQITPLAVDGTTTRWRYTIAFTSIEY